MSAAEPEVRRLCAALWQELIVTRTVYDAGGPVVHVIHVWRSMLAPGTEIGRGATSVEAWADALAALPQRMAERVAEIDREMAAMAEERARIVAALEGAR